MIRRFWKFFTAGSKKAAPSTPDGMRIYVIGDIHGRLDLLEKLHAKIKKDAKGCKHLKIIQVFLGDYIDRGPESKGVIDFLIKPPPKKWKRICLKGNHETMVSKFLSDPDVLERWQRNGGLETLYSYDPGLIGQPGIFSPKKIQKKFDKVFSKSHRKFFAKLKLSAEFGDYFFAHAGVRPGVSLKDQVEEDLIWIRKEFITSNKNFGKIIVHGHTPIDKPEVKSNRINIDTGAWITGKLTCLVLEGEEQRFL